MARKKKRKSDTTDKVMNAIGYIVFAPVYIVFMLITLPFILIKVLYENAEQYFGKTYFPLLSSVLFIFPILPVLLLLFLFVTSLIAGDFFTSLGFFIAMLWYLMDGLVLTELFDQTGLMESRPFVRSISKLGICIAAFIVPILVMDAFQSPAVPLACCMGVIEIAAIVLFCYLIHKNGNRLTVPKPQNAANPFQFHLLYRPDHVMDKIDNLTAERGKRDGGIAFENIMCIILRANGFTDIQTTKASGDYGVDILANAQGSTYAIQCKCYQGSVPNKAVQEVFSGQAVYHCDRAVVVSNNKFTPQALETAAATDVEIWDRDALYKMAKRLTDRDIRHILTKI